LTNLLNLEGWNTFPVSESDVDLLVPAEYSIAPTVCVRCGVVDPSLKRHGFQKQRFMDTPMQGKRVGIMVKRQRYKCLECGQTFHQPISDMDEKRHMTRRLVEYVERRSLERTFSEVAADIGVDEKTVRNIFREHIAKLDAAYEPHTPEWLGIDELFLIHRPRCVLTNVSVSTLIDVLPDRNKPTVLNWMRERIDSNAVEVITMDMWKPYRDAALEALPNAIVVVDKFHVVKMANHALNTIRKSFREGLDAKGRRKLLRSRHLIMKRRYNLTPEQFSEMREWTNSVPVLFNAYQAKEDFFDIYDCTTKAEAMDLYDTWKACLDPVTATAFFELIRAVDNWRPEVFNYFEHRVTNALTESLNGLVKIANRLGRGYSFEAIRAKMLFGMTRKTERFKAPAGIEWKLSSGCYDYRDLGVPLAQIIELFSDGHLSTLKSE
jgi:transposase